MSAEMQATVLGRRGGRRFPVRLPRLSPGLLLAYAFLLGLASFCLVPFLWIFLASADPTAGVRLVVPNDASGANYQEFFNTRTLIQNLLNSLIMAGGATTLVIACSVLGGYVLSRFDFPLRRPLMYGILMTRIIPATATIAPLYLIAQKLGLVDTYHGLILIMAAQQLPLALWLMKGFFDTVPVELEEAAWIDGASRLGSAVRVVLPLAAPGVGAAALFAFIEAWGDFLTPFILVTSSSRFPLSVGLYAAYKGHNVIDWGLLTATSVIYMLPTVILYLVVRRYLLRATAVGALQGQ
jgi:multiple sugar transport system permease protein